MVSALALSVFLLTKKWLLRHYHITIQNYVFSTPLDRIRCSRIDPSFTDARGSLAKLSCCVIRPEDFDF
jgi:hypothetical protein